MKAKRELSRSSCFTIMLLLSIAVIVSGCATSKPITKEEDQYKPYVIDVDKFDPMVFFERMKEERAAREESKITNCYRIGAGDIRFVFAAENDNGKETPPDYIPISGMKEKTYYVSKVAVLDGDDIDMLCIEKNSYKGNEQSLIKLYFKEESWNKVHDVTESLINKKMAVVKHQTVISAPVVHEAIVESANLIGDFDKANMEWLVHDFTQINLQTLDSRKEAYTRWLERRIENYPDDIQSVTSLAHLYAEKKPDCLKSTAIFERVMVLNPERNIHPFLHLVDMCYREAGNYRRAITFYSELLGESKAEPQDRIYVRMALAIAYAESGDTQQALQELSLSLADTQALSLQYPWLETSPSKDIIEKELAKRKEQMIKLIEEAMETVKAMKAK